MICGCSPQIPLYDDADQAITPDQASQAFTDAQSEFEALFDGPGARSLDPNGAETCDIKNQIIGQAWAAYYTGDDTEANRLIDEAGLTEKVAAIKEKYQLDTCAKVIRDAAVSRGAAGNSCYDATNLMTGDIFLAHGPTSSGGSSSSGSGFLVGWIIPGNWKHAGLYLKDYDTRYPGYHIFSGSNRTTAAIPKGFVGSVGYEGKDYWSTSHQESVQVRRVKSNYGANGKAAYNYIKQFYGYPFHFVGAGTERNSNKVWYCSKLVYRAWKSQGVNVEPTPWIGDYYVTPQDICNDNDTTYVGGDSK